VADATFGAPTSLRGRVGRLAQRIAPDLDQRAFFRSRERDVRMRLSAGEYEEFLAGHPPTVDKEAVLRDLGRPPHVVVVPDEGADFASWGPGHRNFYFEAAQTLAERLGPARVSVFHVARSERYASWHSRLVDYVNDVGATHVLTHIESDPGTAAASWTWDSAWPLLASRWDGALLGVMFDSAYRHTLLKGRYLARQSPRFMLVDICMPMDGSMVGGRPEVGPVNMPMSDESLAMVDARLSTVSVEHDISFVGVLYPYRVELIDRLRAEGLTVVVNPHRPDDARTREQTLAGQPGWLEYMAGLGSSRATINFSQSAARPVEQLKTRVLEAGLARTFLFTDDKDRTRLFWVPGVEYGYFSSAQDLVSSATRWLSDPTRIEQATADFARRARELAGAGYWDAIERGLERRGLPTIESRGNG
jgi:hypothetical protein